MSKTIEMSLNTVIDASVEFMIFRGRDGIGEPGELGSEGTA